MFEKSNLIPAPAIRNRAPVATNAGLPDPDVLAFAVSQKRAVLTQNRRDFIRLHNCNPEHTGIIVCTENRNLMRLATCIHEAIATQESLKGKLIRVNRPPV